MTPTRLLDSPSDHEATVGLVRDPLFQIPSRTGPVSKEVFEEEMVEKVLRTLPIQDFYCDLSEGVEHYRVVSP